MRRAVGFLLLTITVVTLAGCGSSRGLGAFSECPRKLLFYAAIVPTPPRATAARRQQTVAQDPRAAELCIYDANAVREPALLLVAHDLLSAADARTLTLLIDARGAGGQSCDSGYPALVRLRYAGGHVTTLLAAGCDPELLRGPSGIEALPDIGLAALSGLADPRLRGPTAGLALASEPHTAERLSEETRASGAVVGFGGVRCAWYEPRSVFAVPSLVL